MIMPAYQTRDAAGGRRSGRRLGTKAPLAVQTGFVTVESHISGLTDITDPRSVGARLRARRWGQFARAFPNLRRMRVLDLGGEISAWRLAPVRPAELVLLNLPPV